MRKIPMLALAALVVGAVTAKPPTAKASSHREAPFLTKNPKVDGTDLYMFNSYDPARIAACTKAGTPGCFVTIIADYQPFQDAWGGPNYFSMDPDALYEIMIDSTGDAVEDVTFQFQFQSTLAKGGAGLAVPASAYTGGSPPAAGVPIPFIAGNAITAPGSMANQNVLETYNVNILNGPRRAPTKTTAVKNVNGGGSSFNKPLDNAGNKTFPDTGCSGTGCGYANYANGFIYDVDFGCGKGKMFVGPRAEPFAVNIGPIFDLVNAPASVITNPADRGAVPNPLSCKNITTLALEVPVECLDLQTKGSSAGIIGGWTTASIRQARVINPSATYTEPSVEGGPWTQVSRLGMPLVNEVIVGLPDKDGFNSSEPQNDAKNIKLVNYASYPTLPAVIQTLFGVPAPATPRNDLLAAFALGVTGVNANGATAEYQRLNVALSPGTPLASQSNLGAALCFVNGKLTPGNSGCDVNGFPNGRRPGDDVVDIELTVAEGYLIPGNTNGLVHDAVIQDPHQFSTTFPYLTTPTAGTDGSGSVAACAGPQGVP